MEYLFKIYRVLFNVCFINFGEHYQVTLSHKLILRNGFDELRFAGPKADRDEPPEQDSDARRLAPDGEFR